jgi:hypothetical protein
MIRKTQFNPLICLPILLGAANFWRRVAPPMQL